MRFSYFFGETVTNLRRNVLMTIAATSTVAISLLLLGGVQILGLIVNNVTDSWEAKVEISVYLRDDASANEQGALEQQIAAYEEVEDVAFVSKADAYEEFKDLYRDEPAIWESISSDDLPASLRIKLTDAKYTEAVAARLLGAPGVDDIRYGGDIIKRLLQVNSLLRTLTFAMSLILLIAAAALIANAIRLAIYARREEIGIMKLVGATNWFIRIPFMLEGIFASVAGAIVAGAVVLLGNSLLFSRIGEAIPFMGPVLSFTTGEIVGVLSLLLAVGMGIGLVGSGMALRRFLDV